MNFKKWIAKLWSAFVKGGSHAATAYIGLAIAHNVESTIPALNLKGLGVVILTSGALAFFRALEESPLPTDETVVVTTETVITKSPNEPKP